MIIDVSSLRLRLIRIYMSKSSCLLVESVEIRGAKDVNGRLLKEVGLISF